MNIVLVSRTQSKLEAVAKRVNEQYNVKTKIIVYDFSALSTEKEGENLSKLIDDNTKDLDVSVLVNNVGLATAGVFHSVAMAKMFDLLTVNCCSQMVMSRYFLGRWANSRKGKKCAIIDYGSVVASGENNKPRVIEYGACKAFNRWFSKGI